MFVAVAGIPATPDALKRAAEVTGLALADVSRSLAGILPRVLVRASDDACGIVAKLEASGFIAFTGDASRAPKDGDRVVARDLEWTTDGFVAVDGPGRRHDCPANAILLFQRGVRTLETSETVTTKERRLDLGRAVMSGGLMLTKKVEKTSVKTTATKEAFVLVQRKDGGPEIMIYEHRCSYRCLGKDMQPAAFANLTALFTRLRALAPNVPTDDRVARPGFLVGLPDLGVGAADLGLYLVALAHGCGKIAL